MADSKSLIPQYLIEYQKERKIRLDLNMEVSKYFDNEKIIPILFCHGLLGSYSVYYGVCMVLASFGYIVFSPNFQDGSCVYTTDKDGNHIDFNFENPKLNLSECHQKIIKRTTEINQIAKEIKEPNFISKLKLNPKL